MHQQFVWDNSTIDLDGHTIATSVEVIDGGVYKQVKIY